MNKSLGIYSLLLNSEPEVIISVHSQDIRSSLEDVVMIPEIFSNSKIISCEKCSKIFTSQKKLARHLAYTRCMNRLSIH